MTIDHPLVLYAAMPLGSYLIGSTPFAAIIGRSKGFNLREHGSGNLGATNVARVVGPKWGLLCFLLDSLKGFLPIFVAGCLLTGGTDELPSVARQFSWICVGLAAVVGHCMSFWLRFRGGKGVATAFGVIVGMWPYVTVPGLVAFGIWIAITVASRYISLASILGSLALFPLFVGWTFLMRDWDAVISLWPLGAFVLTIAVLIVVRHRSNIVRLLAGTEAKIGRAMPAVDPGVMSTPDAAE